MNKSELDLIASIEVLRYNLTGYFKGNIHCYRPVSVELRKLLCDRDPLLCRTYPNIRLHKLHMTDILDKSPSLRDELSMCMPGRLTITNGVGFFELSFANPFTEMEVTKWIEQPFINLEITIREFIKSIADKEGAHSDAEYNKTLNFTKSIHYADKESHIAGITGIAHYVSKVLKNNGI